MSSRCSEEVRETAEQEGEPEPVLSYPGSSNGGGYVTEGEAAEDVEGQS